MNNTQITISLVLIWIYLYHCWECLSTSSCEEYNLGLTDRHIYRVEWSRHDNYYCLVQNVGGPVVHGVSSTLFITLPPFPDTSHSIHVLLVKFLQSVKRKTTTGGFSDLTDYLPKGRTPGPLPTVRTPGSGYGSGSGTTLLRNTYVPHPLSLII